MLLPGFGELPELVFNTTLLPNIALENQLITVIPTLQDGWQSFYVDHESQETLDHVVMEVFKKYADKKLKFYIGGFSLGGSGVVRYAERAYASDKLPKPDAIFAIDPPFDFERLYERLSLSKILNQAEITKGEVVFLTALIEQHLGGKPEGNLRPYFELSPFCIKDTTWHNLQSIKNLPVRLVCEPDIQWQIEERNRDFYQMNIIDCAAMVNILRLLGNNKATLITTHEKGYRYGGKRNPHSWSIADPEETIKWLLSY